MLGNYPAKTWEPAWNHTWKCEREKWFSLHEDCSVQKEFEWRSGPPDIQQRCRVNIEMSNNVSSLSPGTRSKWPTYNRKTVSLLIYIMDWGCLLQKCMSGKQTLQIYVLFLTSSSCLLASSSAYLFFSFDFISSAKGNTFFTFWKKMLI